MDLEFVNKSMTWGALNTLLNGRSVVDVEAGDGARDEPLSSYYQKRCYAYDNGRPEAVLDCIDLEQRVDAIPDLKIRAALILRMYGWEFAEIGAAIGDKRTGKSLVGAGVHHLMRGELDG